MKLSCRFHFQCSVGQKKKNQLKKPLHTAIKTLMFNTGSKQPTELKKRSLIQAIIEP